MPVQHDDRILVDYRTSDDAGVYRLDKGRALVQTVDFFTPIVDDPVAYGRIAAANALSDVYAMGGRPLTALAIAGFPADADRAVLRQIFAGGLEILGMANVALLGGHTVQDAEIKFGYAVTGEVDPARVLTNAGAMPGDVLLLTKAVGTGVIATALKFGRAPSAAIDAAVQSMTLLNRGASEAVLALPPGSVRACTDITGFGVVGHAAEMAAASGCTLEIEAAQVPLLPGALDLVEGNTPGGGRTNRQYFGTVAEVASSVDPRVLSLLFDPQTSGGLLLSVSPGVVADAQARLVASGCLAAAVGTVHSGASQRLVIR